MIKYSLKCRGGHEFESWFASAASFEDQVTQGRIICPNCETSDVSKAIMAPALAHTYEAGTALADKRQMLAELRAFRHYVLAVAEDVGRRFPQEARKIAEGEGEDRPIRGQASAEEAKQLLDEGIHILPIPLLPEDFN